MQTIFKIHFFLLNEHKNNGWIEYVLTKIVHIFMRYTFITIRFTNN